MCTEDEPEDAVATETSNKLVAEEPVTEEPVNESKHSNIGPVLLLIIIVVISIVIALATTINVCSNMPPVDVNRVDMWTVQWLIVCIIRIRQIIIKLLNFLI